MPTPKNPKNNPSRKRFWRGLLHRLGVMTGSVGLTLVVFLVLPLMQTISKPLTQDMSLTTMDLASLEPPPPAVQEEEPEKEQEKPDPTPQLQEMTETPPLDLSQLELALNPGLGGGLGAAGDFAVKLNTMAAVTSDENLDAVFSMADLDQKPRVIYQPGPVLDSKLRGKGPAKIYILFIVDEKGHVTDPRVQQSDNPLFENVALRAVNQWKFEPGKRGGKAVRFRMRVPISFPK